MRYYLMETHRIIRDSPPSSLRSNSHHTPTGDPPSKRCTVERPIGCIFITLQRLLSRVLYSIQSAKASHAQLPDIPHRSDTQALRLIAHIPLIQQREKHRSRKEKSAFAQWFSSVYARSLKDQVRQSKYPRTQILGLRTQPKLICHSSTIFIPRRSNNLNIGHFTKLYSFAPKTIQHSSASYYIIWIGEAYTRRNQRFNGIPQGIQSGTFATTLLRSQYFIYLCL